MPGKRRTTEIPFMVQWQEETGPAAGPASCISPLKPSIQYPYVDGGVASKNQMLPEMLS